MKKPIRKDRFVFNKEVNYSFITVNYIGIAPEYIRMSYLTKHEVDDFLKRYYFEDIDSYENLRIFSEYDLDNKIIERLPDNTFEDLSLREYFFESTYSDPPFEEIDGELHMRWKHGYKEWFDSQTCVN